MKRQSIKSRQRNIKRAKRGQRAKKNTVQGESRDHQDALMTPTAMETITIVGGGPVSRKFEAFFDAKRWLHTARFRIGEYEKLIKQTVSLPEPDNNGLWTGRSIQTFLDNARKLIQSELTQLVSRYSSAQWLWYLRHLPSFIWVGKLATTGPYDVTLAEVLSSKSTATSQFHNRDGLLEYNLDAEIANDILEYCAGIIYLSLVHTNIRWASKSTNFEFSAHAIGKAVPTEQEERSIRLYDERVARFGQQFLMRVGAGLSAQPESKCRNGILTVSRRPKEEWLKTTVPTPLHDQGKGLVLAGFDCGYSCLDALSSLNEQAAAAQIKWWADETAVLVMFLRMCIGLVLYNDFNPTRAQRYGYILTSEPEFLDIPDETWSDAIISATKAFPNTDLPESSRDFLSKLEGLAGVEWPLRYGPPIRREGNYLFLDLCAAAGQLHELLEFRTVGGGVSANLRGDEFERSVRALINSSPWAPPDHLRKKDIWFAGKKKTDLDAIGFRDGTLLLVQCKSWAYTDAYDAGNHQAIRQGMGVVQSAVSEWLGLRKFIEEHPKFDNFDFSQFKKLIFVVCTPAVIYVPLGRETEYVAPGLRAAVSFLELQEWLRQAG